MILLSLAVGAGCGDDDTGERDARPPVTSDGGDAGGDGVTGDPDGTADGDTAPGDLTGDADGGSGSVLCRPCLDSVECGGDNLCLELPSGESVCGLDCSLDGACPDGFFCAAVGAEGAQQCVPTSLYCVNQCGDPPRECDDPDEVCHPFSGECEPILDICEACEIDEECGPNNLCLTFPDIDSSRACGNDCSEGQACPEGYACAVVSEEDDSLQQCVPTTLTCIDRCSEVTCEVDQRCDPLTGECITPLEPCDPCVTSDQCGGELDLCLEFLDGNPGCAQDCGALAATPGECPLGLVCLDLGGGVSQCVPWLLTCTNHCEEPEPVTCDEGQNCDELTGECQVATLDLCGFSCEANYECGGQGDFCFGDVCTRDCAGGAPCPIGYTCGVLPDQTTFQCVPEDSIDLDTGTTRDLVGTCTLCADVECPEGSFCRPWDRRCLPVPEECDELSPECPEGQLCDTFNARCTPVGLPCRDGNIFDCGLDNPLECSATSFGTEGVCLQRCDAVPEGCPEVAPACESYADIFFGVCVERGLGGPERCGRLAPWSRTIGWPCPSSADSTGCFSTYPVCLTDVVPDIPGFCTDTCDPTEEGSCPIGSRCSAVDEDGELVHYCLPDECGCLAVPDLDVGETDVIQQGLDALEAGLTRCDISYTLDERNAAGPRVANDAFRVALAGQVRNEALFGAEAARRQLEAIAEELSLARAIELMAENLGQSATPTVITFPPDLTLCDAIAMLWEEGDETAPDCSEIDNDVDVEFADLPPEMEEGLTEVVYALAWAADQRDSLLPAGMTTEEFDALTASLHELVLADGGDAFDLEAAGDVLKGFKYSALYDIARALAVVLESAAVSPDPGDGDALPTGIDFWTPRGRILIQGETDHVYCSGTDCQEVGGEVEVLSHPLLILDLGGSDSYLIPAAATTGFDEPVSIVIDLDGDDLYGYATDDPGGDGLLPADSAGRGSGDLPAISLSTVGRQGSARGGLAFLLDRGQGSDHYQSLRMSQGFGLLGVGAVVDDGCQPADSEACDVFQSEALSQGAGLFGIGLLLSTDAGPTDYFGVHLVQGAGAPMGGGMLLDAGGNDVYTAQQDTPVLYSGPVLRDTANWSAAQGAGLGVPSEVPQEGGNVSGGVGALLDLDGDDLYEAGILAQGAGYWHGLGLLVEVAGTDTYEGVGYVQAVGLAFGAGVMAEQGGDDTYNTADQPQRLALGAGEDFGVGFLLEEAGNDDYFGPARSLGVGRLNGTGVFVDQGGGDTYTLRSEQTLGVALLTIDGSDPPDNPRRGARTVGLFVDSDGADTYTGRNVDSPRIADDQIWLQSSEAEDLIEYGIGIDDSGGTGLTTIVPLP